MRSAAYFFVFLSTAAACSSSSSGGSTTTAAFKDDDVPGRDANPDGVPYPTEDLGPKARTELRRGQRIPNLTFQGYVGSNRAEGLKPVSLADYYDPDAKRYKLLNIMLAGTWCQPCDAQTQQMIPAEAELKPEGVVVLAALVNGPSPGYGPQLSDLDAFIDKHKTDYTMVIDVRAHRFLGLWQFDALPVNALVDTRTMEILDASVGAPSSYRTYVKTGLGALAAGPRP